MEFEKDYKIKSRRFSTLMRFARIKVASEQQLDSVSDFRLIISLRNERRALQYIHDEVNLLLHQYPTTIAEDKQLLELSDTDLTPNIRNILIVLIDEKKCLMEFRNDLTAMLNFGDDTDTRMRLSAVGKGQFNTLSAIYAIKHLETMVMASGYYHSEL